MHYQVHDQRNGRIFRIDRGMAEALQRAQSHGAQSDDPSLKALFGFLSSNRHMLEAEQARAKPFNPLFVQIPLIDLGRWQRALQGLARALVGPQFFVLFALFAIASVLIAASQDWAILGQFGQIFSISALASFAIVAPFLKLLHEMGHLLVATRYGVTVRQGGLFLIGLYPMPFVDCSLADLQANRNQRIAISLAGLGVDLMVAMVALIAWHFTPGGFGKTLLANIFFFSSLNSLLFNGNPLIKLDGYYALADWIGQRNLGTRAHARLKLALRYVTHLGGDGALPRTREELGLSTFGFLSMLYRINILITIAWIMLPRFFGLGFLLVLWGGYVMFLSPMLSTQAELARPRRATGRRILFWSVLAGGLAALLLLVRAPYVVVLPLALDQEERYSVTYSAGGSARATLVQLQVAGWQPEGAVLMQATSLDLAQSEALIEAEAALLAQARDAVQGIDPAETIAATERLRVIDAQRVGLAAQRAGLELRADADGIFAPAQNIGPGVILQDGQRLGSFFPDTGASVMIGQFPDRYVELFRAEPSDMMLRLNGAAAPGIAVANPELIQITRRDTETGDRSYVFQVELSEAPASLLGSEVFLRLRISDAPLWQHVRFRLRGLQGKLLGSTHRQ